MENIIWKDKERITKREKYIYKAIIIVGNLLYFLMALIMLAVFSFFLWLGLFNTNLYISNIFMWVFFVLLIIFESWIFRNITKPLELASDGIIFTNNNVRLKIKKEEVKSITIGKIGEINKLGKSLSLSRYQIISLFGLQGLIFSNSLDNNIIRIETEKKNFSPTVTDISGLIKNLEKIGIKSVKKNNIFYNKN